MFGVSAFLLALLVAMYQYTIWQEAQRRSVIDNVTNVNNRLSFLESTIVGNCPQGVDVPDNARCKQGFHQEHGKTLRDEIIGMINTICIDNNLECWQIK